MCFNVAILLFVTFSSVLAEDFADKHLGSVVILKDDHSSGFGDNKYAGSHHDIGKFHGHGYGNDLSHGFSGGFNHGGGYKHNDFKHGHHGGGYGKDYYAPPKYDFSYAVHDPYNGANYGHSESRDGHNTKGQYFVHLPDGRLQKVSYYTDEWGYHPTVTYEGEAKYPAPHKGYGGGGHHGEHHGGFGGGFGHGGLNNHIGGYDDHHGSHTSNFDVLVKKIPGSLKKFKKFTKSKKFKY